MNLTIAAFYGPKPAALGELISTLQAELAALFGGCFAPYDINQVHATILGLEGVRKNGKILNANLTAAGIADAVMDLAGLFRFLRDTTLLPMRIRIGGFAPETDYGFTSRGHSPHIRSCFIDSGTAVFIGWPHDDIGYPPALDGLRRACMSFNALHKYHLSPGAVDNDLFFVLGHATGIPARPPDTWMAGSHLRKRMQELGPLDLLLGHECLSVVAYSETTLPPATTRAYSLEQVLRDPDSLAGGYGHRE